MWERALMSSNSLPKYQQQPGMGWGDGKSRSLRLHLSLLGGGRDPSTEAITSCFPGLMGRKLKSGASAGHHTGHSEVE